MDIGEEDPDGNDLTEVDAWIAGITFYPAAVAADAMPFALQPYVQRAGYVRLAMGIGEAESVGSGATSDVNQYEFGTAVISSESGLGARFLGRYRKIALDTGTDLNRYDLEGAFTWQDENGFAVELVLKESSAHDWDELGLFPLGFETVFRGVGFGVRKAFVFEDAGQALDLSASAEFGKFDWLNVLGLEDESFLFEAALTYYPAQMFGIGVSVESRSFEDGSIGDFEYTVIGGELTFTIVERVDVDVSYTVLEKDLPTGTPLPNEISTLTVTVGLRF